MKNYKYVVVGKFGKRIGVHDSDLCSEEEMRIKAQGIFIGAKMLRQKVSVFVYSDERVVYKVEY